MLEHFPSQEYDGILKYADNFGHSGQRIPVWLRKQRRYPRHESVVMSLGLCHHILSNLFHQVRQIASVPMHTYKAPGVEFHTGITMANRQQTKSMLSRLKSGGKTYGNTKLEI